MDLVTRMMLHLSGWKDILHVFSHSSNAIISFWSSRMSLWLFISLYTMASSVKSGVLDVTHSGKSFMNITNNSGPNTVHWGTPLTNVIFLESF
jgi:hypothetical protein